MKYTVDWLDNILKKIKKDSNRALMYCWEYLEWKIKEQLQEDSYDTGALAGSVNHRLLKDWVVEVWTNLDYAVVREYWRKPWTFPPLNAIAWRAARKWMISWWVTTGYNNLHYKDKWVVFVIARSIAIRGIEGKNTFQNVYKKEKQNIINLFNEYMQKW